MPLFIRRLWVVFFLLVVQSACTKDESAPLPALAGLWKFSTLTCACYDQILPSPDSVWHSPDSPSLLIEQGGGLIRFAGESPINGYVGSLRIGAAVPGTAGQFSGELLSLSTTKRGGTPQQLALEQRYFDGLRQFKGLYHPADPSNAYPYETLLWRLDHERSLLFIRKR
jgi:hypothetical protein